MEVINFKLNEIDMVDKLIKIMTKIKIIRKV